ncbi:hypothetical protein BX666DRAFT_1164470 [Dichotomocladium elegans]|nr:hypothetical protein BX666DRAFT_1164470 [Dichotomocladium elegans]
MPDAQLFSFYVCIYVSLPLLFIPIAPARLLLFFCIMSCFFVVYITFIINQHFLKKKIVKGTRSSPQSLGLGWMRL